MSDDALKKSLEEMLAEMAKKMMPLVSKGPGTMFRLSFTKDSAKAEFFMGDTLVLQFTFEEEDDPCVIDSFSSVSCSLGTKSCKVKHGKNENGTQAPSGKN